MPPTQLDLIRAKLDSVKSTIARATPQERAGNASAALAEDLNRVIRKVADIHPELKDDLPHPIRVNISLRRAGRAPVTYLDVEAFCEQILGLLRLVGEE